MRFYAAAYGQDPLVMAKLGTLNEQPCVACSILVAVSCFLSVYKFTLGAMGSVAKKARYTFTYVFEQNQWKITHHHTHGHQHCQIHQQGQTTPCPPSLFTPLPSDASGRASPCPPVAIVCAQTKSNIKDYHIAFLKKKPPGIAIESNIWIRANWCQDTGIYEFDLLNTKVKSRYSSYCTFEDDQWKIKHHHSSQISKEVAPKTSVGADKEVHGLFGLLNLV
jgi:hypothetical protein